MVSLPRKSCLEAFRSRDPSIVSPSAIRLFQSGPSAPALLLGVREVILPLCWLLNFQPSFLNQEANKTPVLMTIDRTVECIMRRISFPLGSRL